MARFNSGAMTVSVSDAEQAPVVALKEPPAVAQAVPGLVTPVGGVTEAVLVTVVCASAGRPARASRPEARDRVSLRRKPVAFQLNV